MIDWNGNGSMDSADVGISIAMHQVLEAAHINLLGYPFFFVQELSPERNAKGEIRQFLPHLLYPKKQSKMLHKYGSGPFCRFSISNEWCKRGGVYALFDDDKILYIGQTINLGQRYNAGYGVIAPINCYEGGQSTNCKINGMILRKYQNGEKVYLFFCETADYDRIEHELIQRLQPPYNAKMTYQTAQRPEPADKKTGMLERMKKVFGIQKNWQAVKPTTSQTADGQKIWENIVLEFSNRPRDVKTVPLGHRTPVWFYVSAVNGAVYVESGHDHANKSNITGARSLNRNQLETMLDLYYRRKHGESVSQEAGKATINQVYWYGIFSEIGL